MKKILAIVQHRKGRSPGQRFRFEHFIPYLEENGYQITYSNLLNETEDKIFYSQGKYFSKALIIIQSFFRRLKDLKRLNEFDIVYVYREAFWLGTVFFERQFSRKKPMIFDYDDAIWLNDTSDGNKAFSWLKRTSKTGDICRLADVVIVGNEYLAEYAQKYNDNVVVIPTTIDTNYHKPDLEKETKDKICIGWTGTETTLKHFDIAIPVLKKIKEKFGDKVYFKVIVNTQNWERDIDVKLSKWTLRNEISDLLEFDIGIMPLPDDKWSRGKCGFKGLQCMSLGIPVIMSPVGVNVEIIKNGENGFLASHDDQWFDCLTNLIINPELRKILGENGRKTVVDRYSVLVWKSKFLKIFDELLI
ncbi:MAG: glycosyltransferase family 4 protein [Bacteroidales bacterium]|jgi:glycosyltransferase involved in cell wall biosynthesis|nr:glycosyltransferase family 4 protein [Bacteroidales bacterium]HOL98508.1 glycosyltransferase family 4 protein [Bacteroidales bacterium]HOM36128.1 glycosyltransferase family 4 protein [Bacteroidales bacterium]HPD23444.1 glycosyltransferase family 4 protein [Bacteroidales bacterium]HRS99576.1 glycosyltransferase family 4 protein [Bacteroidales bacterium]